MKFSTAKEHRDFFQKQGWIEFEGLVPEEQLVAVNEAIDQVLGDRLNIPPSRLKTLSSEKCYLQGHDLWRSHPILEKLVAQTRFAEIVSELIEKKPLRLGYDQFFPARQQNPFPEKSQHVYSRFIEQTIPLETVSCLQGVACGFIIALSGTGKPIENEEEQVPEEGIDVFPNQAGNVIFFQPHVAVNWAHLYRRHSGQKFYMVVYTQMSSRYQLEPQDPHTHELKRLGYIFNDKLNDKLHPIIYR